MTKKTNNPYLNSILLGIYCICFLYLVFQDAIYTPDTGSHFRMEVYRSPVYSSFVVIFKYIFKSYFDIAAIIFQLILGFTAVHLFFKKIITLLKTPIAVNIILLAILLFPFFNPLMVANNICSEGFSYPLYLAAITFGLTLLFENKHFWLFLITTMLLSLTRAQFALIPLIFAFVYCIKHYKSIKKKSHFVIVLLLVGSLFMNLLIDKTFHKITKDQFASTSSIFIANTAAMFVSEVSDINDIEDEEAKAVFKLSRDYSNENGWLRNNDENLSYEEQYANFHNKLTRICSYSFHYKGSDYLKKTKGYTINKARVHVEKAAKNMMPVLVKNNFKKYIQLYYGNLIHGIKSQLLLLFIVVMFFYSLYKIIKSYDKNYSIVFLLTSLILSNALIVSFGSYSIVRLLFYHYSLIVLLLVWCAKIFYQRYQLKN